MSFFIMPVLTTPLLKIPVLLSDAVFMYYALRPPNSGAPLEMQEKFTWSDYITSGTQVQLTAAAIVRTGLAGLVLLETMTILARDYVPGPHPVALLGEARAILLSAPGSTQLRATPAFLVGSALTIVGGLLRSSCYRALGRLFAWQVGVQANHELITTGPYAVVRHPSYTALVLIAIGTPLALLSAGSYYVETGLWDSTWGQSVAAAVVGYLWFVTGALIRRIDEEEAELEKEFGETWRAWAVKTPYKLIPYVY